jgi:hypothetical protein
MRSASASKRALQISSLNSTRFTLFAAQIDSRFAASLFGSRDHSRSRDNLRNRRPIFRAIADQSMGSRDLNGSDATECGIASLRNRSRDPHLWATIDPATRRSFSNNRTESARCPDCLFGLYLRPRGPSQRDLMPRQKSHLLASSGASFPRD